ncbi:MAG: bifunctional folylpolyglutamate synthase/dihydrofolate synthase [Candidatus Rhabdochlamydia sp.]|jgi:dihydrofolate synthase/folylpolyglutamate synthase|nr:dihydrofolate synthase / folylpolyglutamate synthase [Chlamydiota bacterium]
MSNYKRILKQLLAIPPAKEKSCTLENVQSLHKILSCPTSTYPTIHVAGTNGKGSVSMKIAKALECSGYRVGLVTSPHIISPRERICINSELISEEEMVSGVEKLFQVCRNLELKLSFFELMTFLAFDFFCEKRVDIAVVETGLGGRLDATNILCPVLTVITSISKEHVQFLGENLEKIAFEKAGILKLRVPVILGPRARFQSIYKHACALKCPVFCVNKVFHFFDEENSEIAKRALEQLKTDFMLTQKSIDQALIFRPSCRFEICGDVIFDVAHNPEAIFYLLQALHYFFPQRRLRFVVGFSKDKDYESCLELIAPVAVHIHLVQGNDKLMSIEELSFVLKDAPSFFYTCHQSIEEGVKAAFSFAFQANELTVVCGSFYIMQEAKSVTYPTKAFDLNMQGVPIAFS